MTDDPFAGFAGAGEGGFDLNALLQQAEAMQAQLLATQNQLAQTTFDGTVANGLVTATVTGTGELTGVRVATDSFDPADADSMADLGDLIVAAYRAAKSEADQAATAAFGPAAGALGLDS